MRPDKRGSAASTTTLVVFALPVIWLGLIGGSCAAPGRTLIDWINAFGTAIEQPWHFSFNQYSLKAILIALAAYALCIMLYRDSQRKRRPGEEYGSAEWGNAKQIDSKYRYHDKFTVEVKQTLHRIASFFALCAEFITGKLTEEERQRRKEQKALAVHVDQNIPLTMHVARHCWASVAKSKNIPLSVISEGMGHDSEETTRIYLASLDTSVVDKANSLILKDF